MNADSLEKLLAEALRDRYEVRVRPAPDEQADVRLLKHDSRKPWIRLRARKWEREMNDTPQTRVKQIWVLYNATNSTAEQLRKSHQSFADLSRNAVYLDLPDLLVDRVVRAPSRPELDYAASSAVTRPLVDPFADRASLLTRVLLESPGTTWTVTGLAETAGVASMLSSHIVRQLAAEEIVTTQKEGRKLLVRLVAPRRLLEAWSQRYDWRRNAALAVAAPVADEERFLRRLVKMMKGHKWALTLLAGAWRRTRYTPTDRLHAYVDVATNAELKEFAREMEWVPDRSGRLVLLRPTYRTAVWHEMQSVRGVPIVSDVQLIVDLWHYPVRGRETAEQMLGRIEDRFRRSAPQTTTER